MSNILKMGHLTTPVYINSSRIYHKPDLHQTYKPTSPTIDKVAKAWQVFFDPGNTSE